MLRVATIASARNFRQSTLRALEKFLTNRNKRRNADRGLCSENSPYSVTPLQPPTGVLRRGIFWISVLRSILSRSARCFDVLPTHILNLFTLCCLSPPIVLYSPGLASAAVVAAAVYSRPKSFKILQTRTSSRDGREYKSGSESNACRYKRRGYEYSYPLFLYRERFVTVTFHLKGLYTLWCETIEESLDFLKII